MKLNDEELILIKQALGALRAVPKVTILREKIDKQLTKHNWKLDGSPGIYDSNYICTKCGLQDSESADSSYRKPEFGCTGEKP